MGQLAVAKSVESRNSFIPPVIVAKIQLLQIFPTLRTYEEPSQVDLGLNPLTQIRVRQAMAVRPNHVVDQGSCRDPLDIRQRRLVQILQNELELILRSHFTSLRYLPVR